MGGIAIPRIAYADRNTALEIEPDAGLLTR